MESTKISNESDEDIQNFIEPHLKSIGKLLKQEKGQFMIAGMDRTIIDEIINNLSTLTKYKIVKTVKNKDLNPENKVFVLNLENNSSMEYQSLLYYYLELPLENDCFVCLTTTSSLALEFFEKRVRSRFKNKIFFVPYVKREECDDSNTINSNTIENNITDPILSNINTSDFKIYSSLESIKQQKLMKKYGLKNYSIENIFTFLEPIHFVLLDISFTKKLDIKKCYDQYKIAVVDTPELKRVSSSKVLYCVLDLLECGFINLNGSPLIDLNEFKSFVSKKSPLYLKKLIFNNIKRK